MAGSQTLLWRGGRLAAVLILSFFAFAGRARAQNLAAPSEITAQSFGDALSTPETTAGPMTVSEPSYYPGPGAAQPATPVEMGLFDTITESIFGKTDPNTWRPLPLSTFFSEGWDEAWVASPSGSGGAPRQGWINAAAGNLYRLSFFTFAEGFNRSPASNAYLGSYTILTPLSRRLELITNIPFVLRNNVDTGLPIEDPNQPAVRTSQNRTSFGDITFTPRVLLHETQDFSVTAELAVTTPTGTPPLAGTTTILTPAIAFWNNFSDGWVIRGGLGVAMPTDGSGDTLISQLAIGQTVTGHDVPLFGDFTYYVSAVVDTPLSNGSQTSVTLTPGVRTYLGHDWFFVAGLPTPLTSQRVEDFGMIFWFIKAW
jgi:hypothetical protein